MLATIGVFSLVLSLSSSHINVPMIMQMPELPTGCEAVATTMLVDSYGFSIDKVTFTEKYLAYDSTVSQDMYRDYFFGNPFSIYGSYCNPSVCCDAISKYFYELNVKKLRPVDLTGKSLDYILGLVSLGIPVAIWVTQDYGEPVIEYNDYNIKVFHNTHCVVLTGYENDTVLINDSLQGQISISYNHLQSVYNIMDKRALAVY